MSASKAKQSSLSSFFSKKSESDDFKPASAPKPAAPALKQTVLAPVDSDGEAELGGPSLAPLPASGKTSAKSKSNAPSGPMDPESSDEEVAPKVTKKSKTVAKTEASPIKTVSKSPKPSPKPVAASPAKPKIQSPVKSSSADSTIIAAAPVLVEQAPAEAEASSAVVAMDTSDTAVSDSPKKSVASTSTVSSAKRVVESDDEQSEQDEDDVDDLIDDDEVDDGDRRKKSNKAAQDAAPKKSIGKLLSSSSASKKYSPIDDAGWTGDKVPYLALSKMFEKVEATSSRLAMIELCSDFFRSVIALSPNDLVPAVYLTVNKIAPAYEGLELGVGDAVLVKAISEATGRSLAHVRADAENCGDLGDIAAKSRSTQRTMFAPKPLNIRDVYKQLRAIASEHGHAAMKKKGDIIKNMLVAARESEAKYIVRSLQGKLRIGLAEQSALVALSRALTLTTPPPSVPIMSTISAKAAVSTGTTPSTPQVLDASRTMSSTELETALEEATRVIKCVYCELPNYEVVIPAALCHGVGEELMNKCQLTPGVPVKAMLAKPTKGISEVLSRFAGRLFTLEYKYDGERAQIHVLPDGSIAIFSRNSENNTQKYPDLCARLREAFVDVKSCILDCEVVAFDKVNNKILPFQILSTRKRKAVATDDIKVDVCIYAFDLLYLNDKSLLREPFVTRRDLMNSHFREVHGEFVFAKHKDSADPEDIQTFLNEAIQQSCEGLMVKTLEVEATYEPDKRSHNWLKVKKDYLEGVGDTLDLVPIGGYHGKGKRTGVYGAYLMACYDQDTEEYQSICKIGTGFSDEQLESLATSLNEQRLDAAPVYYKYPEQLACDVWFSPSQVWEVLAADLSISPAHKAALGLVDDSRGIALRFPRLIRKRDDKGPEDATSAEQVADMYRSQANRQDGDLGDE